MNLYTGTTNNCRTTDKEDLDKLIEALKPTYMVVTNREKGYKQLLEMPFLSEDCVKLSNYVDGTFIIDMKYMEQIAKGGAL